jgi:hypothetical protein
MSIFHSKVVKAKLELHKIKNFFRGFMQSYPYKVVGAFEHFMNILKLNIGNPAPL